jgi:hypothetical protein
VLAVNRASRRLLLAGIAVAATLVVGGVVAVAGVFLSSGCSDEERAVFAEFAQFGGRTPEPEGNPQLDSCAAYYDVSAPGEEVLAYYRQQLRERGWRIEMQGGDELVATRREDGYHYQVETEPSRHATHVAAHVSRLSEV